MVAATTDRQRMRMRVELGLVDSGYFDTLGIRLFAGREFTAADAPAAAVAIVNETFVRRAWPGISPAEAVGRTYLSGTTPVTIVGVAADSKYSTLSEPPTPFVYRPQAQRWDAGRTLFVRVNGDGGCRGPIIQEAVASIDPLYRAPP